MPDNLTVAIGALTTIRDIAWGSRTANSLPHIGRIADAAIIAATEAIGKPDNPERDQTVQAVPSSGPDSPDRDERA